MRFVAQYKNKRRRFGKKFITILLSCTLTSCMVGPNFKKPQLPPVKSYTQSKLPPKTVQIPAAGKGGKTQYFISNLDIPAEWWTLFRSPDINRLIEMGLTNSPNLVAAQAALRQAQETLNAQVGNGLYPAVDALLSAQRQKFAGATLGDDIPSSLFSVYGASVNVSYTLDLFGGARRGLEALVAQVDYQQFQLIAAYLTLTSNIVTTSINIASFEGQIKATEQLIKEEDEQLRILKEQFRLGGISNITVLTQETLVEQTRATLPPLQRQLSQAKHALAVLTGNFPNKPMPSINLDKLNLPTKIPVSLPSYLVRQRPDVRASEALLHAATAQVGVATANLFPQFTLSANYGWSAPIASTLFNQNSETWLIGGQLLQPVFRGGALRAQRRAAIAAYDQSAAQYRQTVLQAFQNVADSLRALETDARALQAQKKAELAARENLFLAEEQYRLGSAGYVTLLIAQEQYQQARIARIRAQAARYADTAALFQALGGGWWNRTLLTCHDPINPMHVNMVCP